ncbi:YusW family protein [Bacillus sp. 31A1R]|uniref:YusW family protein n=1 Tax=Robertmurraya mangrovi TaxID=3098077 RepID=A0ABU5IWQ4_9BACI|nr:YusW family protein [Bacillus sp. 31A1R]MDZ5471598.1 YusW family protein [Bacillus sp. 31A1R]
MTYLIKLSITLFVLLIVQGCNNDRHDVSAPPENAPVKTEEDITNEQTNPAQNEDGTMFNFSSFDLDIEYEQNKSYDASYENETDEMEAEIKDQIKDVQLQGDEAFERLKPLFQKLTFDQTTEDEKVIEEVLNVFELDSSYKKFELEVEFSDGTEKEYKSL